MDDKIRINLKIAEENYPLTISRDDEEIYREAAKQVNIRLNEYRARYPSLDLEKVIAMVAYGFSLETLRQEQRNDTAPYTEKIKELTGVLEDYFKSNTLQ